jgi:MFS family permease
MKPAAANNQKNIEKTYLLYQFFSNMFFVSAVWLYFYRLFITDAQVGILDGIAFAIGLIAEVPSGALADKFGRSRITRLGLMLAGCGVFIQAAGGGFVPLFIGQSVMMIGMSFVSGADEALFFTKLDYGRDSIEWRKLVTKGSQMALTATLAATLLGGWLHTVNPHIPWVMNGITFFIAALLIWGVKDTGPVREKLSILDEVRVYFEGIADGFRQFASSELLRYVPLILTVQALFYATSWGLLRIILLDRFHFDPFAGSVVAAICIVLTIATLGLFHRYSGKMNEGIAFGLIAVSAAASLILSIPDIGFWGAGVIFVLYAGERILHPFLSETLNKHANEKHRATTLSVASFFKVLPYIGMAPLIGTLNAQNHLGYFLIGWAILIGLALLFYFSQAPRKI